MLLFPQAVNSAKRSPPLQSVAVITFTASFICKEKRESHHCRWKDAEKMCLCQPIFPSLSIFVFALWPISAASNPIDFRCPLQLCLSAHKSGVMNCRLAGGEVFLCMGQAGHWHPEVHHLTACISRCCAKVVFWETLTSTVFSHCLHFRKAEFDLSHFHKLTIFLLCFHRLQQRASIGKSASLIHRCQSQVPSHAENSNPALHVLPQRSWFIQIWFTRWKCIHICVCKGVCVCVFVHYVGRCLCVRLLAYMHTDSIRFLWIIPGSKCDGTDQGISWWQKCVCLCVWWNRDKKDWVRLNEWRPATCK